MSQEQSRREFEEATDGPTDRKPSGEYKHGVVESGWVIWDMCWAKLEGKLNVGFALDPREIDRIFNGGAG